MTHMLELCDEEFKAAIQQIIQTMQQEITSMFETHEKK